MTGCRSVDLGDGVAFLCAGDMAEFDDPEYCVCCERHGERSRMLVIEHADREEWWHEACAADNPDLLP